MTRALLGMIVCCCLSVPGVAAEFKELPAGELPPGWLPVDLLDGGESWKVRSKSMDHVQLYLPPESKSVRGIFICYVFHSGDPRELARLWNFALVTIPVPFEYDVGYYDRRNQRPKVTGLDVGNMGVVLDYLAAAAKDLTRPELATVPIVGWLGQNGATLCNDLFQRAPERLLAWSDAWYPEWPKHPDLIAVCRSPRPGSLAMNESAARRARNYKPIGRVSRLRPTN